MPGTPRAIPYLEDKFQTGDIPTQQDFQDLFASFVHYLTVKQEGGSSITDVMSQKAVTDLVNPLFANQAANRFYCGPASGAAAAPGFRAIEAVDVPFVYKNDGNAFGANVVLGLIDNFNLTVKTNNADRIFLRNDGHIAFNGAADGNFNYTFNNPLLGIKSNSGGQIYFADSDAGADAKNWVIVADTNGFLVRTLNDAYNTVTTPLYITRTTSGGVGMFLSSPPSARLHVRGAGTTTGELFRLDNSALTNKLLVLDSGSATVGGSWTWTTGNLILSSGSAGIQNTGGILTVKGRGTSSNQSVLFGSLNPISTDNAFAWSFSDNIFNETTSAATRTWTALKFNFSASLLGAGSTLTFIGYDYSPSVSANGTLNHYAVRWMADNAFLQFGTDANRTIMTMSPTAATRGVLWSGTSGYSDYWMHFSSGNSNHTSGTRATFRITQSNFQPDGLGSPVQKILELVGSVNQLNGSTSTLIGIDYNPSSVNATNHYGLLIRPSASLNAFGHAIPTALVDIGASTVNRSGFRLRPGPAPSGNYQNGDIWIDETAHTMHVRINGVTKTFTLT